MSDPLVCCVCLVNGRPDMVRRAVASFRAQTYPRKSLLIYDTSEKCPPELIHERGVLHFYRGGTGATIGALRNEANEFAMIGKAPAEIDIIAHWDSDDWSHPNRLAEQVALLQASGAECVGYHQAVFWDERFMIPPEGNDAEATPDPSEYRAYVYTGQVPRLCLLGSSLCYWRKTWERVPFEDVMTGEDARFVKAVNAVGVSAISIDGHFETVPYVDLTMPIEPRLIASIHGANTVKFGLGAREFRRAPELDAHCRERMKL